MINETELQEKLTYWNNYIKINPHEPKGYVQRGMIHFKLANIEQSITDFDCAETLDSSLTPYLWQRGLSYFYAQRYLEGAKQFEIDLTVNSQDVEETVWRYLCLSQCQNYTINNNKLLVVKNDSKKLLNKIYQLFANTCQVNEVLNVGKKEGVKGNFYAHLYVGLYYESQGNIEDAKIYLIKSLEYQLDDYMWYLAHVHKYLRNW